MLNNFNQFIPNELFGFALKTWLISLALLIGAFVVSKILKRFIQKSLVTANSEKDSVQSVSHSLLQVFSNFLVWGLTVILLLDNFGVQVSALVAGLGVGGIAIALAAQNILGDLFAALTIGFDKPFQIGDSLLIGTTRATVESIGIKTTRLRGPQGEQWIFGNEALLKSQISNFGKNLEKRVSQTLGLTYDTSLAKLDLVPKLLKSILENHSQARFERAVLLDFAESSLNFEFVYWLDNSSPNLALDIQHQVNLEILKAFSQNSINFAYPTRTLITESRKP